MTTATPGNRTARGGSPLRGPMLAAGLAGVAAAVTGGLLAGRPAVVGAAGGAALVCVFFGFGALVLGAVMRTAPAVSLLVALLTYVLQVVALGVLTLALARSGFLGESVDSQWLGGTVIGCTLVWVGAHLVGFARMRQPLYGLPADGKQANAR